MRAHYTQQNMVNNPIKNGQNFNRHSFKEDIWIANKYMKRYLKKKPTKKTHKTIVDKDVE